MFSFFFCTSVTASHALRQEAEIEVPFFPVDSHLDTAAALTIVLIATHLIELPRFPTRNARQARIADRPGRNQPQWKASRTTKHETARDLSAFAFCSARITLREFCCSCVADAADWAGTSDASRTPRSTFGSGAPAFRDSSAPKVIPWRATGIDPGLSAKTMTAWL